MAQLTDSDEYLNMGPDDIVPIILHAQKNDDTTKLILGDSFADQTLGGLQEYNPDFAIMTSNGAITMSGQYVIAKEYLESHPDATDIYLFVLPESLGRTYDTEWGYPYAVLPFIVTNTISDFEDSTIQIMKATYGEFYMNEKIASLVDKSGINRKLCLNRMREKSEGYKISYFYEISDIYLTKLSKMCEDKGVAFHFYPCPVSDGKMDEIAEYERIYGDSKTYNINPNYYDNIHFYPAEWSGDGTHLYTQYRGRDYIYPMYSDILGNDTFMDTFNFG